MNFMLIFTVAHEWSKVLVITTRFFALVSSGWCWTPLFSCPWRTRAWKRSWLSGRRSLCGVGSGVLAIILNHVPLYLHFCSVCVVWEVGHMITINRCEEAASNIFNTPSITWHTPMPCTPWIIITGLQLQLPLKVLWGKIRRITTIMAVARWLLCST